MSHRHLVRIIERGAEFLAPATVGHNVFLYTYEGSAKVGADGDEETLPHRSAERCPTETRCESSRWNRARFLLLGAVPLREPVVQHGPFVMNTREEIEQAVNDYREGRLAA